MSQHQLPAPATTTKASDKLYSTPIFKDDKEFLLNESTRTGLSQKEIVKRAIIALKRGTPIPNAMPIKL